MELHGTAHGATSHIMKVHIPVCLGRQPSYNNIGKQYVGRGHLRYVAASPAIKCALITCNGRVFLLLTGASP